MTLQRILPTKLEIITSFFTKTIIFQKKRKSSSRNPHDYPPYLTEEYFSLFFPLKQNWSVFHTLFCPNKSIASYLHSQNHQFQNRQAIPRKMSQDQSLLLQNSESSSSIAECCLTTNEPDIRCSRCHVAVCWTLTLLYSLDSQKVPESSGWHPLPLWQVP